MAYTLSEAAKACGRGKTTVLRMIKQGKLSAARDPVTGGWMVEPVELHRLYRPVQYEAQKLARQTTPRITELETRLDEKDALITVHERTIDDLRRRLDRADEERRQVQARFDALLADHRPVTAPAAAAATADSPRASKGWFRAWRRRPA